MQENELSYWLALSNAGLGPVRSNKLIAKFWKESGMSIVDFFADEAWRDPVYELTDDEQANFSLVRGNLSRCASTVDLLLGEGYGIVPVVSPTFPRTLKANLKFSTPTVMYTKGNLDILNRTMVAIVGARKADGVSLDFTRNVARMAVGEGKAVVSGFAKGVDQMANDAALACGGESVIILPQGIRTARSVYSQVYEALAQKRVLAVSFFLPDAGWDKGLAMARNAYIYGMADKIFAAESNSSGGTWSGVLAWLQAGREVSVRMPDEGEKCANKTLIQFGARAVDVNGVEVVNRASGEVFSVAEALLRGGGAVKSSNLAKELKAKGVAVDADEKTISSFLRKCGKFTEPKRGYFALASADGVLDL